MTRRLRKTLMRREVLQAIRLRIRTAWHGPGDVLPIGYCANVTLDVSCYNFGIQEGTFPNDRLQEVFDGYPVVKDGYAYANEKPGWGVEVNQRPRPSIRSATDGLRHPCLLLPPWSCRAIRHSPASDIVAAMPHSA